MMANSIELRMQDEFNDVATRWNSNEDIASILISAQMHPEWIASRVLMRPCSGQMILYQRKDGGYYKHDGYLWIRRRDGKMPREDHMKLKVRGMELLSANYVHSALVPTFHRRAYWLLQHPDIVLVHYLHAALASSDQSVTSDTQSNTSGDCLYQGDLLLLKQRIVSCLRSLAPNLPAVDAVEMLVPMLCSPHTPVDEFDKTALAQMVELAYDNQSRNPTLMIIQPPNQDQSPAPGTSQSILVTLEPAHNTQRAQIVYVNNTLEPNHAPLGRSSSCSSASRRGLSSIAMRRQPSALSDSVDREFVGGAMSAYVQSNTPDRPTIPEHDTTQDGLDNARSGSLSQPMSSIHIQNKSKPDSSSMESDQSQNDHAHIASIIDYSPDWAFVDGQTKVLVTGPWHGRSNQYACLFGNVLVPAALIQGGVLRTKCPAHCAGTVQLSVVCDQQVISNSVPFDYRHSTNMPSTSITQSSIESVEFLRRLEELGHKVDGSTPSFEYSHLNGQCFDRRALEAKCIDVTHKLFAKLFAIGADVKDVDQVQQSDSVATTCGNLLHHAVRMRFHQLLTLLLRWRSFLTNTRDYVPDCLKRELDVCARNKDGATPLFLACRLGSVSVVECLLRVSCEPLNIKDSRGRTPLDVARAMKADQLVNVLVNRGFLHPKNFALSHAEEQTPSVDATTLWVLSDGVTTTDQRLRKGSDPGRPSSSQSHQDFRSHLLNPADRRARFRQQVTVAGERLAPCVEHAEPMDSARHRNAEPNQHRPNLYRAGKRASLGCENELHNNDSEEIDIYQPSECTEMITALDCDDMIDDDDDWFKEPINTHIPVDLQVPDSPRMTEMWMAVTSPAGFVNLAEYTKQQFANLAQAIIDSLPEHVKLSQQSDVHMLAGTQDCQQLPTFSTAFGNYAKYCTPPYDAAPDTGVKNSVKINADFFEKPGMHTATRASPLQRDFEELRLSDREQRELYEAAKVIQNAFRQYKARVTTQRRQTAMEVQAAITIQSYYRRYKQYCYFKKLHNAAVLIQKHFRMYRQSKQTHREPLETALYLQKPVEHPLVDQLVDNNPVYGREHAAAIRIQHAYRGHYERKRQAAARKIQKFMRESRKKLRQSQELDPLPSNATMLEYAPAPYASAVGNLAMSSTINGSEGVDPLHRQMTQMVAPAPYQPHQ